MGGKRPFKVFQKLFFFDILAVEKLNVGDRLKRVSPKFEAERSHPQGVNGRSKFYKMSAEIFRRKFDAIIRAQGFLKHSGGYGTLHPGAGGLRNVKSWGLRFFEGATFIQSLKVRPNGRKKIFKSRTCEAVEITALLKIYWKYQP